MESSIIIFAISGAPLTLFLHESAHVVAVWCYGGTLTSFRPYPHFYDGRFYFGRVAYLLDSSKHKRVAISPLIKAITLTTTWAILGFTLYQPLLAFAAWEAVDALWWVSGFLRGPHTDAHESQ